MTSGVNVVVAMAKSTARMIYLPFKIMGAVRGPVVQWGNVLVIGFYAVSVLMLLVYWLMGGFAGSAGGSNAIIFSIMAVLVFFIFTISYLRRRARRESHSIPPQRRLDGTVEATEDRQR